MGLLTKLKSFLGLDGQRRRAEGGTAVTIERERDREVEPATERAVKESGAGTEADVGEPDEPGLEAETVAEPTPDEVAASSEPVETIRGIGPAYAERLAEAGIETVADLAGADAEAVAQETDIAQGRVEDWIEEAKSQ